MLTDPSKMNPIRSGNAYGLAMPSARESKLDRSVYVPKVVPVREGSEWISTAPSVVNGERK